MVEANVADPGSGVGRMIVVVEGYVRPEGLEGKAGDKGRG